MRLRIVAGEALDPRTDEYVEMPLPYGSRVRLIMMYLNAEALRSGQPTIDVGRSLTTFATSDYIEKYPINCDKMTK